MLNSKMSKTRCSEGSNTPVSQGIYVKKASNEASSASINVRQNDEEGKVCTCPNKNSAGRDNYHRLRGQNMPSSLRNNPGCQCKPGYQSKTIDSAYNSGSSGSGTFVIGQWSSSPPGGGFILGSF